MIGYVPQGEKHRVIWIALAALGVTRLEARCQLGLNHIENNENSAIILISRNIFIYTKKVNRMDGKKGRPSKGERVKRIIPFPKEMDEYFREKSEETGAPITTLVVRALQEWLDEQEK